MTREEEIKARLAAAQCTSKGIKYIMDAKDILRENAEDDIHYILDRNEELQRRVKKLEKVAERARAMVDLFIEKVESGMARSKKTYSDALEVRDELFKLDAADAEEK